MNSITEKQQLGITYPKPSNFAILSSEFLNRPLKLAFVFSPTLLQIIICKWLFMWGYLFLLRDIFSGSTKHNFKIDSQIVIKIP